MSAICPLGLCRFEADCPNAPCLDCMRRLGAHMIEEIQLISRQARTAAGKGDRTAAANLADLLDSLGGAIQSRMAAE